MKIILIHSKIIKKSEYNKVKMGIDYQQTHYGKKV